MAYTIDMLAVGQKESFSKTISDFDIYSFAGITGDFNPVHINDVAAEESMFKRRIAHGMLSAGFISTILGTKLPGPGTIYLGQDLKFKKPVYPGDTVTTVLTVTEIFPEKNMVKLETVCTNQNGESVITGTATVLAPTKE